MTDWMIQEIGHDEDDLARSDDENENAQEPTPVSREMIQPTLNGY